jgi:hypothetical protein
MKLWSQKTLLVILSSCVPFFVAIFLTFCSSTLSQLQAVTLHVFLPWETTLFTICFGLNFTTSNKAFPNKTFAFESLKKILLFCAAAICANVLIRGLEMSMVLFIPDYSNLYITSGLRYAALGLCANIFLNFSISRIGLLRLFGIGVLFSALIASLYSQQTMYTFLATLYALAGTALYYEGHLLNIKNSATSHKKKIIKKWAITKRTRGLLALVPFSLLLIGVLIIEAVTFNGTCPGFLGPPSPCSFSSKLSFTFIFTGFPLATLFAGWASFLILVTRLKDNTKSTNEKTTY